MESFSKELLICVVLRKNEHYSQRELQRAEPLTLAQVRQNYSIIQYTNINYILSLTLTFCQTITAVSLSLILHIF